LEEAISWSLSAGFGPGGAWSSFDLQARPEGRASEVTTIALRCFGGRAFGTTIGPGGVPEKTETSFPPGSAVRGWSVALDGLVAASAPLRVGHGRRLLVVEVETDDLVPRVRDWMLLAVSRVRVTEGAASAWATGYEFRPADAPGRCERALVAGPTGLVHSATRSTRAGPITFVPGRA
jgi:hypothetical protein